MAFASLFTKLSAVDEVTGSRAEASFPDRNQNGERRHANKRKPLTEHTAPFQKKGRYQGQKTDTYNVPSFDYDDPNAIRHYMPNTDSERASVGFTEKEMHSHGNKAGRSDVYDKSPTCTARNRNNLNKQQWKKKKKTQHHMNDKQKQSSTGGRRETKQTLRISGGDCKHKGGQQDVPVKRPRLMTQDFMDQNVLLVDGQVLCRHFLWGRCIKGDDCQLQHIQGYNDLIKEVCKFYVQGFCIKGDSCPYMHKSFPCKFFHRKGRCSQGADCRFSHEPLNEVTNRLLDEALQRESDLYKLAKKADQESSGQPVNTDESEMKDVNQAPDRLIQPVRPNFYNSEETNAEQEALLGKAEEASDGMEEAVAPNIQPHSPASTQSNHEEPVCYSVEAILGRQLFKPLCNLFTAPQDQESTPLCVRKTSGSAGQSEVPYSVDAVLRSCKSVEDPTAGHTPTTPAAQTLSCTPKTDREGLPGHLLSSEMQNEKVLCARNEATKSHEKMFKSLSSHQVHTGLRSKTCSGYTVASGDHRKQGETLKPARRVSQDDELELHSSATVADGSESFKSRGDMNGRTPQPTYITCSLYSKSEDVPPLGPSRLRSLISSPKHPTKPRVSGLTCGSQASVRPRCPSGLSEFKGRAAVSAEPVTSFVNEADSGNSASQSTAEPPTEVQQHSKKAQSRLRLGTQQCPYNETAAECSSETAHCDETQKIPFNRLFARPITESPKPATDPVATPAAHQGFAQSSCLSLQSAPCTGKHADAVLEPDKASARSFLSLFASPPSAALLQCTPSQPDRSRTTSCSQESHQSGNSTSHLSESNQSAHQDNTDDKQPSRRTSSPKLSTVNEDHLSETSCSPAPRGDSRDPSASQSHQRQPSVLSPKGSAVAAPADSLLKSLFVCLSPYQQDGEQQNSVQSGVPSESEKDKRSAGCVFKKQQKSEKRGRQKTFTTQDSHQQSPEKACAHSAESVEEACWPPPCSPAAPEPQVKNRGVHTLPFKVVTPPSRHRSRPQLKHNSEEGTSVDGNVGVTQLKDLFKTLDTTVFHFGH